MLPRETRRNQGFSTQVQNPLCCTQDCAFVHVLRLLKGTAPPKGYFRVRNWSSSQDNPCGLPSVRANAPKQLQVLVSLQRDRIPLPLVAPRAQGSADAIVLLGSAKPRVWKTVSLVNNGGWADWQRDRLKRGSAICAPLRNCWFSSNWNTDRLKDWHAAYPLLQNRSGSSY